MKPLTVVIPHGSGPLFEKTLFFLTKPDLVEHVFILCEESVDLKMDKCRILVGGPLTSQKTLSLILEDVRTKYLLVFLEPRQISIKPENLERILNRAESTKAGLVYSDFYDESEHEETLHPLNDYQPGSVRDDFDFGATILFSVSAIRKALKKYGLIPDVKFAGLYDLRLKVSIDHSVYHLQEPLYAAIKADELSRREKIFAYVDPRNEAVQKEMEIVFTDYLKKIGAYLPSHHLREVEQTSTSFPVEASVIIPVRNRRETIAEAVKSALSQKTDFPSNVIVVDNHSTDGTTVLLSDLARKYASLKHVVPKRMDLGIGGCWNEALHNKACGRYAVQLDSDDLYSSTHTLQKMIDRFHQGNYAMVIGSYTLVGSKLEEIPPGLIDHREWTDENGHNNALRINGLGAPRAFNTDLMRKIGLQNVSYGEDYAAALRICRQYRIGRIYEGLYLCRRWSGNTDANLGIEEANRNDAFKDKIRTMEILARQKIAKGIGHRETAQSPGRLSICPRRKPFTMGKTTGRIALLNQKTHTTFAEGKTLPDLCKKLLSEQRNAWQDLQKGYESFKTIRERDLPCRGFSVRLQYNPGRIKSSTADVAEKNRAKQQCFLCLDYLPQGQKGISYRNDYLILCNPMPVFSSHFTVSHVDHRLQAIAEHVDAFLQLMADFGSGWVMLYNGPKCGASAPDHLHFQAAPSGQMPIEKEIREEKRLTLMKQVEGVLFHRVRDLGREAVVLQADDSMALGKALREFLDALKQVLFIDEEPMMNIAGFYEESKWRLVIFPRRKHRPEAFSRKGDDRIVVSPGAIDMGGVLITPVDKDFNRLDGALVEDIFGEVSLDAKTVEEAIDAMQGKHP